MLKKLRSQLRLLVCGLQYREIFGYLDIDGWLKPEEAATLYDLARGLPEERPVVVEIGSWLGKSSLVLGRALAHKRGGELHCIDPFNAAGDDESRHKYGKRRDRLQGTLLDEFRANMREARVLDLIRIWQGYSNDFVSEFTHPVDMVFIDGNHAYDAVLRDFRDWSPLVKPGGVLAFHDVGSAVSPGPGRVVDEYLRGDEKWPEQFQVRSLYVARRAASTAS
jgi:predicted O-methyltransferase YrrM